MADETTPTPEAGGDAPAEKPEEAAIPEEAPVPEEAPGPEEGEGEAEALIPEEGEEPTAEAAEGTADTGGEDDAEAEDEDEVGAKGGPVSKLGFVLMTLFTLGLTIGGLGWYYVKEFSPNLKELKKYHRVALLAEQGNATAQLKFAEMLELVHEEAKVKGQSAEGTLLQAFKWYSLAARTANESKVGQADAEDGEKKEDEKKEEEKLDGAGMLKRGKAYWEEFGKASSQERQVKLFLAFKWLKQAEEAGEEATDLLNEVDSALAEMGGDDLKEQAGSVLVAAKKLEEMQKRMAPDQLETARNLVSAHALKEEKKKHGEEAHWTYEGISGPDHWGAMKREYAQASHGTRQSPINIVRSEAQDADFLGPVKVHYNPYSTFEVVNNGHTIHVNVSSPKTGDTNASTVVIGEDHYRLAQFHFHWKSEHTREGEHTGMEVHLVHAMEERDGEAGKGTPPVRVKAKQPKLAVIGVMIRDYNATSSKERPEELGDPSEFIGELWETLDSLKVKTAPGRKGSMLFKMDPSRLLPSEGNRSYYQYRGSLTTPPCTENVLWTVMEEPIFLSAEQIKKFSTMPFMEQIGRKNNRPVQPTNSRFVLRYQDKPQ